eukprot:CAMPEP_0198559654 /NCGR_PEP_ID=MMETSP1462-20131121/92750_1 /TAXON_ID=1333877 /ORGANISM="Brandtodinium nutriculum, Strain RCC3387" /LENGTH=165 /DNA_ID=CAMNT_0044290505 /DNA_START=1 /DNA_END=495 /DNA_ORIENTATION=-
MRLLICQVPRLSYLQAGEIVGSETYGWDCQMVLFPEMAFDHPPQCTDQGELTFENVGLMAMSTLAKRRRLFIVMGSVEERTPDGGVYDTCVVIDPDGEMVLKYRKMSPVSNRWPGTEPGVFATQAGPVGVLLGAEAEEPARWAPILACAPFLVLNPARAPTAIDP